MRPFSITQSRPRKTPEAGVESCIFGIGTRTRLLFITFVGSCGCKQGMDGGRAALSVFEPSQCTKPRSRAATFRTERLSSYSLREIEIEIESERRRFIFENTFEILAAA